MSFFARSKGNSCFSFHQGVGGMQATSEWLYLWGVGVPLGELLKKKKTGRGGETTTTKEKGNAINPLIKSNVRCDSALYRRRETIRSLQNDRNCRGDWSIPCDRSLLCGYIKRAYKDKFRRIQ
jgi:hypothetical protein